MKRLIIPIAVAALLAPVAATAADPPGQAQTNAARACKALRTSMGAAAFNRAFGANASDRNAYGKCVARLAKLEQQNIDSANSTCQAEQADATFAASHGGKTFAQFYGTNENGNNAFGMCVSQKAKAKTETLEQQTVSAAKACKAEMKADPAVFRRKYGKSRTLANAYGKCVSAKVRANG